MLQVHKSVLRTVLWLLSTALLFSALTCCAPAKRATALTLLQAVVTAEQARPAGDIYLLPDSISLRSIHATQDEGAPTLRLASRSLLCAAFAAADGELPWELSLLDDGAMWLSTAASPFEVIVLHCPSRSDTAAISDLLLRRLTVLQHQYRGSDVEHYAQSAQLLVIDRYVLLVLSSQPSQAIRTARRALS